MHRYQRNKLSSGVIVCSFLLLLSSTQSYAAVSNQPFIHAASACLMDVESGRVLYEKNAHQPKLIASLTKIVTGWIAVRSGKLEKSFTVSANAARQDGSSVYLRPGERLKLIDLVYAMMLRSGNDAATAIAEALAGSTDKFSLKMNDEVRRFHLKNTHFVNPHGLDHKGHYSSAFDLTTLTAQALKNPLFHQIVHTKYYSFSRGGEFGTMRLKNKNKLLWMTQDADGVKTGYTRAAGRCLAASASLNGRQVVLIVLDDPSDWEDAKLLLGMGLNNYKRVNAATLNQKSYTLTVIDGMKPGIAAYPLRPIYYPVSSLEEKSLRYIVTGKPLRAPIRSGKAIGHLTVRLGDKIIGETSLVATENISAKSWWGKVRGYFRN